MRNSLGFYPALIAIAYLVFALLISTLQFYPISQFLHQVMPFLAKAQLSSKAVLTTLVTGIISLTALSFSMVMVVLSFTSSTFSPKLILGLISEKAHQVVLGNYIGTIVYCLILLLGISGDDSHAFAGLAVIIAAVMGVWCLVLFVYFIHHISTSIQINRIMQDIYELTKKEVTKLKQNPASDNKQAWLDQEIKPRYQFSSRQSGFFQDINTKSLVAIASSEDLVIRINHQKGDFVVADAALFSCSKSSDQLAKSVLDGIYNSLVFFTGERIGVNYRYGFTQLMEIAVKALSPGINDPGTACICVDYLSDLFVLLYKTDIRAVYYDSNNRPRLIVRTMSFESLFNICIGPIQHYGKGDLAVSLRLLRCFSTLAHFDSEEQRHRTLLNERATSVIREIKNSGRDRDDFDLIDSLIDEIHHEQDGYFDLS